MTESGYYRNTAIDYSKKPSEVKGKDNNDQYICVKEYAQSSSNQQQPRYHNEITTQNAQLSNVRDEAAYLVAPSRLSVRPEDNAPSQPVPMTKLDDNPQRLPNHLPFSNASLRIPVSHSITSNDDYLKDVVNVNDYPQNGPFHQSMSKTYSKVYQPTTYDEKKANDDLPVLKSENFRIPLEAMLYDYTKQHTALSQPPIGESLHNTTAKEYNLALPMMVYGNRLPMSQKDEVQMQYPSIMQQHYKNVTSQLQLQNRLPVRFSSPQNPPNAGFLPQTQHRPFLYQSPSPKYRAIVAGLGLPYPRYVGPYGNFEVPNTIGGPSTSMPYFNDSPATQNHAPNYDTMASRLVSSRQTESLNHGLRDETPPHLNRKTDNAPFYSAKERIEEAIIVDEEEAPYKPTPDHNPERKHTVQATETLALLQSQQMVAMQQLSAIELSIAAKMNDDKCNESVDIQDDNRTKIEPVEPLEAEDSLMIDTERDIDTVNENADVWTKEDEAPDQYGWSYEDQFKTLYEITPDPERKDFLDRLFNYMQKRGTPVNRVPIMAKHTLDLYELFRLVVSKGGLVEVISHKLWREIATGLNLPTSITSAAFTLRTQYMKYLYPFECEFLKLSTPTGLQSAIDGNRRDSRGEEVMEPPVVVVSKTMAVATPPLSKHYSPDIRSVEKVSESSEVSPVAMTIELNGVIYTGVLHPLAHNSYYNKMQ